MNHEKWAARFEDLLKDAYAQVYGRLAKDIQAARDEYAAEKKAWESSHAPKQSSLFVGPGSPGNSVPYRPSASSASSASSATSLAAAHALTVQGAISKRERVFNCISAARYGRTDEEISLETGIVKDTVRPRRVDLQTAGRIKDSGRTRPGVSGRQFTVWVVVLGKSLKGWTR